MPVKSLNVDALEKLVLEKCDSFVNMGIWPAGEKLNPVRWLENFLPHEKEHSLYLLNAFTYFNVDVCLALLKGSIINLSRKLAPGNTLSGISKNWREFLAESIFVPVIGERPNITDSGNLLAAYLRRDLYLSEDKILTINQLYDSSIQSILKLKKRVIFFDDFVGTGTQFNTMWTEDFNKEGNVLPSVEKQCSILNLQPHYCAMIGTEYGIKKIQSKSCNLDLNFGNVLSENASPLHTNSFAWPTHLKESAAEFILTATRRSGIAESDLKGMDNLGLAIAFSFTMPDATLPIFHVNNSKWKALMEKS